jgi:hypothetical protein
MGRVRDRLRNERTKGPCNRSKHVDCPLWRERRTVHELLRNLMESLGLLTTVALLEDLPAVGLVRGQVGTVVERLPPDGYEVEFSDDQGRTYASLGLKTSQLLVRHTTTVEVA